MIRIIKQGTLQKHTYRFECSKCGCIFEADGYDVNIILERNVNCNQNQLSKCPCCGRFVAGVEVGEGGKGK